MLTLYDGLCRRRRRDDSRERSRRREEERRCVASARYLLDKAVLSIHLQSGGPGVGGGKTACLTAEFAVVWGLSQAGLPIWLAQLCMLVSTGWHQRCGVTLVHAM